MDVFAHRRFHGRWRRFQSLYRFQQRGEDAARGNRQREDLCRSLRSQLRLTTRTWENWLMLQS